MRVDQILHPLLEFGADQVVYVMFCQLLRVSAIFESHTHLRVLNLDQVPFYWERLCVHSQVLLFVENRVHRDQLRTVLKFHKVFLRLFHFYFKASTSQNVSCTQFFQNRL